jgi:hypothetical protein
MSNLYNVNAPAFGQQPTSTLTAFFDSRSAAETAIGKLKDNGVSDVRLMPGYEADVEKAEVKSDDRGGFFEALESWFFPDEDRDLYAEGLRRGGFLVSASVDDANYDMVHDILDDEGSIDMDERADLWRTEGWSERQSEDALADLKHDQAAVAPDDVFEADAAARAATGVGRHARSLESTSPRVRAYELGSDVPEEIEDDVLPTGRQRTVAEGEDPVDRDTRQSEELDRIRQEQSFPHGR